VYLASGFVFASCFALYSTVSSLYRIREAGLDPFELILVGSVLELSVFLFEIPTGVVADVYSRRLSVWIGYAVVGIGFWIESAWTSFATILAAQVVWGVGHTFISGAQTAWLVDELQNEGVGEVFVRRSQVGRAGALIGILLGVWLGGTSLALPMRIAGGGMLLFAVTLYLIMPETMPLGRDGADEERRHRGAMVGTFRAGVAAIREQPTLLVIVALTLLGGIASEPLDRLWELHLLQNFALPDWAGASGLTLFGGMRVLVLLIGIGAAELVRRWVRFDEPRELRRGLLLMNLGVIVGFGLFALAPATASALFGYLIGTLLRGTQGPLLATWTNQQLDRSVRATVLSMTSQADALGQVTGGPALGALGRALGVRAALLTATGLFVPIQWLLRRRTSRAS